MGCYIVRLGNRQLAPNKMIKLPILFETTLQKVPALSAAVRKNFDLFEPWLEQSGMPFFPGFTDHSPRHITDVLETASSLLSDASRELLSAEDVAVLSMSILLHDCGMHLTQDGFRALIANPDAPIVSGLGDRPWQELWKDFLAEASRFGQEKLIAIFGDSEPLRIDQLQLDDLSERDCLLIGEFVRRHHARLAHEIALQGVPHRSGPVLELAGLDEDVKDLAGLVARSHGMSIRSTFPYIEARYGLVAEHGRVKTPFLMAVLRIADYVQVQSERALKSLLSVKELRSPISRQEWRNHFAVRDVSTRHDDPEALYVHAAPSDVRTYLRLKALFKDIQRELDQSWATIGEVYGRRGDLASLGLSWRRIRSNLDSADKFASSVPYIPIKAGFDASGPDLLKLLVGPLYDYAYEVGIRELVQNAVDACRELADLSELEARRRLNDDGPDVLVEFHESDDGTGWVTIVDRGVGMTLDTVTRYFLIAGASFRNSDVWKRQHTDESGRARVLRGGRFGVGALAAFLLGDEIKVQTRHISRAEADGLEFTARMDEPNVELRRCVAPSGTSIRVWISDKRVFDRLRPHSSGMSGDKETIELDAWASVNWFAQEHPKVKFVWNGFDAPNRDEQNYPRSRVKAEYMASGEDLVPSPNCPTGDWQMLPDSSPYEAILWRYPQRRQRRSRDHTYEFQPPSEVTVNGIRVRQNIREGYWMSDIRVPTELSEYGPKFKLKRPSMAIFDPSGICPINLQRSSVSFDRMGVDDRLAQAVLSEHIQKIVKTARSSSTILDFQNLCKELGKQRAVIYEGLLAPLCALKTGITLRSPHLLVKQGIQTLFFVHSPTDAEAVPFSQVLNDGEALVLRQGDSGVANDLSWFRGLFANDAGNRYYSLAAGFPDLARLEAVALLPGKKWRAANEKGKVNRQIIAPLKRKEHRKGFDLVVSGEVEAVSTLVSRMESIRELFGGDAEVSAWRLNNAQELPEKQALLCTLWLSALDGAVCAWERAA